MDAMNALDMLKRTKEALAMSGIDDASREAELIVSFCLGADRAILYRDNPRVSRENALKIEEYLQRRSNREPIQYIIGFTEFYGLKLEVGPGVLIPRPETEILAEEAIKIISKFNVRITDCNILDLCTGTGCLAIAIAKKYPEAHVYGSDISESSMNYSRANAMLNGIKNIIFLQGSLFEPVKKNLKFDLIISNPPYIKLADINLLQPEIKNYEPAEALNGGGDGLSYYRTIIPAAKTYLKSNGILMLEIGLGQSDEIKRMAEDAGFIRISLLRDYAGIERIFIAAKE
jgi:release factor glutamine methyltransferase